MELIISIELSDDDDIDPDVATTITEPVGYLLNTVSEEVRQALIDLFREVATEEEVPDRRAMAMQFPEAIGLVVPE
ncbi:hypothetical protein [Thermomonospora umbrina]|uniref:Uncharacterized protein n=1 Tax=Thermomonospora umbrina TaxID=111806 RepID=A0A3D9SWZ4_9ACTN|nr:hypothetical protein [Thermomonospora umbrina]REF00467.1 hypothetical protein DFJ69_6006 [Thermomonospora umbrina]